jgi:hypothetical protein
VSDDSGGPVGFADEKHRARERALRTARVVTLGLALTGTTGCETVTDAWCTVFHDNRTCCARSGYETWNETTHRCEPMAPPRSYPPVPGPMVPPS